MKPIVGVLNTGCVVPGSQARQRPREVLQRRRRPGVGEQHRATHKQSRPTLRTVTMRPIPRVLLLSLSLVLRPCSSTPPPTWTEWNADSSSSPKDKQAMDLMSENRDENLGWITGSSNSLTPADRSFVQRSSVGTNTKHNVDVKHQVNLKRQVDALFTNIYSRFRKQKAAQRFFERLLHDFPVSAPRSGFEPGQVDKQSVQVFQQKGRRAIHLDPLPRSSWKQIRWSSRSNPHHAREEVLRRILSFSLQVS